MVHIKLENLTKIYGGKIKAIDNISLEIEDGEYLAVLGPTGAGKTTTMYLLAGLISPTAGKILFDSQDVTTIPAEDREIGFVFEEYNLFPHLNVESNLLFGPMVKQLDMDDSKAISNELLHLLNIDGKEESFPSEISGGQKQRVALARAINANPRLLIMDDPLRALDAKIREKLQIELRKLVKDLGITCIHATHDTREAMRVADKIAVFNEGQIVQIGTPEQVYTNPKSLYIANFLTESTILEGTISMEKNSKNKYLQLNNGTKIAVETEYNQGTKVISLLPAELVDIYVVTEKEKISYDNVISAKLIDLKCIGDFYEFHLDVKGIRVKGRELIGKKLPRKIGGQVLFATDKDDYRLFLHNQSELNSIIRKE